MVAFAGLSLHLEQEFPFFSSENNSLPLFLSCWSVRVLTFFSNTTFTQISSLAVGINLTLISFLLFFFHHCTSLFHISWLPLLLPNLIPPVMPSQLIIPLPPLSQELSSLLALGARITPPSSWERFSVLLDGFCWHLEPFACYNKGAILTCPSLIARKPHKAFLYSFN